MEEDTFVQETNAIIAWARNEYGEDWWPVVIALISSPEPIRRAELMEDWAALSEEGKDYLRTFAHLITNELVEDHRNCAA